MKKFLSITMFIMLISCNNNGPSANISEVESELYDLKKRIEFLEGYLDELEDKINSLQVNDEELLYAVEENEMRINDLIYQMGY